MNVIFFSFAMDPTSTRNTNDYPKHICKQVSISSMLNARIFRTNAIFFSYILALNKLTYKKIAQKMLMKSTVGLYKALFTRDILAHNIAILQ